MKVIFAVVKQLKAVAKKAQKKKSEASTGFEPMSLIRVVLRFGEIMLVKLAIMPAGTAR